MYSCRLCIHVQILYMYYTASNVHHCTCIYVYINILRVCVCVIEVLDLKWQIAIIVRLSCETAVCEGEVKVGFEL